MLSLLSLGLQERVRSSRAWYLNTTYQRFWRNYLTPSGQPYQHKTAPIGVYRGSYGFYRFQKSCWLGSQVSPSQQGAMFILQYAHWPWPWTQTMFSGWPQFGQRGCFRMSVSISDIFFYRDEIGWSSYISRLAIVNSLLTMPPLVYAFFILFIRLLQLK